MISNAGTREHDIGLNRRDASATGLVAVIGVLSWAYFSDQRWPLVSGPRVVAILAFCLSVISLAIGSRSLSKKLDDLTLLDRFARLRVPGSFILMVWVLVTANTVVLGVLVGFIGVMWLGSTIHHALVREPSPPS